MRILYADFSELPRIKKVIMGDCVIHNLSFDERLRREPYIKSELFILKMKYPELFNRLET